MYLGHRRDRVTLGVIALAALSMARPSASPAQQAALSGTFHTVWVDPESGTPPAPLHFVTDPAGAVRLEITEAQLAAAGGRQALERRRVSVSGTMAAAAAGPGVNAAPERVLRVTSLAAESSLLGATAADGSLAYATLLCRFPDLDALPGNRARYQAIMGTQSPGLDHYWRELSEGRVDLAGSIVTDWYVLPQPYSYYVAGSNMNLGRLVDDCTGAADADVDFSLFDGVNLQFNADFPAAWGGSWQLDRDGSARLMPMTWLASWGGQAVYAHEMGHSFGLPHSSGSYGAVYDSPWDVMSYAYVQHVGGTYEWVGQHTISYHKSLLGWTGGRSRTADGEVFEATIERGAQPAAGQLLELRIPIAGGAQFYTVEARRMAGYDEGLPREGIVIHHVDPSRSAPAHAQDGDANGTTDDDGSAWLPGETFADPANRIAVHVARATSTGWNVIARTSTVEVTATVTGPGIVTASPGGIACPVDCSEPYAASETVTLSAAPSQDAMFVGWSGACSGTAACTISPTTATAVGATFVPGTALTVAVTGPGSVTSSPGGIDCPGDCAETIEAATAITLTATAADDAVFSGWGGACSGSSPTCQLSPAAATSVTATFSAPLAITSSAARPGAIMGAAYADQLEAAGGDGAFVWSVDAGALPEGLTLAASGAVSGVAESEGEFTFTVRVVSGGIEATRELTMVVTSPALDVDAVVDVLIAPMPALTQDERRYLDLQGNHNGKVDAGDVRAWLQRRGLLTGSQQ